MMLKNELPVIKKKKKINLKEFVALANRVRKYFEEEEEYLRKQKDDENYHTSRFSVDS